MKEFLSKYLFPTMEIVWIFILTIYVSYIFIGDHFNLMFDQNFTIVKVVDYGKIGLTINSANWETRTIYKPIKEESLDDISYFTYKWKQFLISNNQDDFNIWLIAKTKDNNGVLNLFSHNFPNKVTSGTYFYNTWKVGDYVTASNWKSYVIYNYIDYKVSDDTSIDYVKTPDLSFIYFTCLPNTVEFRRVYFFKEKQ